MKQLFGLILILFLVGCTEVVEELECETDNDCVPASCCHAISCVNAEFQPDCAEIACTLMCEPGTLDCGGKCLCQNNKCVADIVE